MFWRFNIKLCEREPCLAFHAPHRKPRLLSLAESQSMRGAAKAEFLHRSSTALLTTWTCIHTRVSNETTQSSSFHCPHNHRHQWYLLWDVERLEKADFVRPASHSRLSCMLAKALRSLTSRRMSCGGINLSPRFPIRTSDSLPKAALRNKAETYFTYSTEKRGVGNTVSGRASTLVVMWQHFIACYLS